MRVAIYLFIGGALAIFTAPSAYARGCGGCRAGGAGGHPSGSFSHGPAGGTAYHGSGGGEAYRGPGGGEAYRGPGGGEAYRGPGGGEGYRGPGGGEGYRGPGGGEAYRGPGGGAAAVGPGGGYAYRGAGGGGGYGHVGMPTDGASVWRRPAAGYGARAQHLGVERQCRRRSGRGREKRLWQLRRISRGLVWSASRRLGGGGLGCRSGLEWRRLAVGRHVVRLG